MELTDLIKLRDRTQTLMLLTVSVREGRWTKVTHPDYQQLEDKLFSNVDDMMAKASSAERIAAVVYEAATDGKDQVMALIYTTKRSPRTKVFM